MEVTLKIVTRLLLCCVLCASLASLATARQGGRAKAKVFHTSGTYSDITAGQGGDYGGMEIYLTDSDGQFYATVTVAEGVLLPPVLVKVNVQVETRRVEFELPTENGARKFTGTVSAAGLTLNEGGQRRFLKRKCY